MSTLEPGVAGLELKGSSRGAPGELKGRCEVSRLGSCDRTPLDDILEPSSDCSDCLDCSDCSETGIYWRLLGIDGGYEG